MEALKTLLVISALLLLPAEAQQGRGAHHGGGGWGAVVGTSPPPQVGSLAPFPSRTPSPHLTKQPGLPSPLHLWWGPTLPISESHIPPPSNSHRASPAAVAAGPGCRCGVPVHSVRPLACQPHLVYQKKVGASVPHTSTSPHPHAPRAACPFALYHPSPKCWAPPPTSYPLW